ncbi:HWE histidine kinase domain-containing protein [Pararhodobacter sp. SW119]|uniref:sensor histidine kinase n=1 Tax=Pararhodobacter sp. SW119 TaxID=2780075 RepID=UPI001ADF87E4|nr:HWE histidine kinase domain-containing protein [Pararhodobacter sp. SW119]
MKIDVHQPHSHQTYLTAPDALQEGLRLGGGGIWRWRIDSEVLEWTCNLESVHQLPPGSFDGTLASFQRDIHPEDVQQVWDKISTSIETGAPYRAVYRTAPRPGAPDIWIETSGGATTDAEGNRYLTGICLDVSERVRNERQLERRLAEQNAVARFGSFALNEESFQKVLDEAVRVAAEVLQVPLTKILEFTESAESLVLRAGIGWADGLVGRGEVGIDRESQAGYTLVSKNPVIVRDLRAETRFSGPKLLHDHQVRSGLSVIIPGPTSRPFGVFGIHARDLRDFDATDAEFLQSLANIVAGAARQVAAAENQQLLLREMAHRVGNLLQLVSSIGAQTFNAAPDIEVARRSFSARLSALARSNYAVSRGGWTMTRFPELFEEALKPFGDRISGTGRDVLLPPQLSFDMGLVLHELATNSVKYGGLGRNDGKVSVTWSYGRNPDGARQFRFVWEDPSPGQEAPVAGTGFGSKLIAALIEGKWNGTVTVDDGPGFRVTLEVPVAD